MKVSIGLVVWVLVVNLFWEMRNRLEVIMEITNSAILWCLWWTVYYGRYFRTGRPEISKEYDNLHIQRGLRIRPLSCVCAFACVRVITFDRVQRDLSHARPCTGAQRGANAQASEDASVLAGGKGYIFYQWLHYRLVARSTKVPLRVVRSSALTLALTFTPTHKMQDTDVAWVSFTMFYKKCIYLLLTHGDVQNLNLQVFPPNVWCNYIQLANLTDDLNPRKIFTSNFSRPLPPLKACCN